MFAWKGLEHHLLSRGTQFLSKMVGIRILTASVTEFCPATATPLGLPYDYHEQCRKTFQVDMPGNRPSICASVSFIHAFLVRLNSQDFCLLKGVPETMLCLCCPNWGVRNFTECTQ